MKAKPLRRAALLAALLLVAGAGTSLAFPAQQAPAQDKADSRASAKSKKPQPNAAQGSANSSTGADQSSAASGATAPSKPAAARQSSPANNQVTVWVNTETGVYHKPGSRWYGKTKKGKYMTEADAKKAGYREAKKKE